MLRTCIGRIPINLAVAASFVVAATTAGRTHTQAQNQTTPSSKQGEPGGKTDPKINEPFKKPNVREYVKKFETEDRENYGIGTRSSRRWSWSREWRWPTSARGPGYSLVCSPRRSGLKEKVYAVDIARPFLEYIAADAKKRGQEQVVTVLGSQDSTNLPAESVDRVFLSDVYHHLEKPEKTLASIRRALKPGGRLVVIEFDKVEGRSSAFVLKHVRASQAVFRKEIEVAGFKVIPTPNPPKLKENFFLRFEKSPRP